jgi:hypothetical protein
MPSQIGAACWKKNFFLNGGLRFQWDMPISIFFFQGNVF